VHLDAFDYAQGDCSECGCPIVVVGPERIGSLFQHGLGQGFGSGLGRLWVGGGHGPGSWLGGLLGRWSGGAGVDLGRRGPGTPQGALGTWWVGLLLPGSGDE
jgi:hypothetical protein